MNNKLVVLVLGVGGNISQGILKALAVSRLPCRVVGACINPLALGLYTVDKAYVSPRADDPTFIDWLINTCRGEGVQAILSGVEPVLNMLAGNADIIKKHTGAVSIVSSPECLLIGDDKFVTCQWLQKHGFNFPKYAALEDKQSVTELIETSGYPLIAKPRSGKGASNLQVIHKSSELRHVLNQRGYVIQEYLGKEEAEYTAGCFCDQDGQVRGTIVMRRDLLHGTTYRAEVGEFPEVRIEAARITAALRPRGPCNVQIKMSVGRPVCFEINVRFSGTTPLRARLGFNEVEAALRHYVLGEPLSDFPIITEGIVLRYWNEMYIDPKAYSALCHTGLLENPKQFGLLVEDYGKR